MLTFTFLGVGSAFAKKNLQSNALIEAWSADPDRQAAPDDTLLVDFGTTGPLALHQLKGVPGFSYLDRNGVIDYPAIRRIFITHQHSDHIGGIEELAGMNMHYYGEPKTGPRFKPQIISSSDVLADLWNHSLKGGLSALTGRRAQLEDYFDILAMRPAGQEGADRFTMLDRYDFTVFPTDHIQVQRKYDWPSYGLLITDRKTGDTIFYSGDTRFDPEGFGEMLAAAKTVFHEVQLEDQPEPVHSPLSEMRTFPEGIRKKTILYHYGDTWDGGAYDFVADEFAGFAQSQHRYTLLA
ncbi:MAG: MBL fold metallo-hydrolase [Phycisphaerae bacterium]